jgi:hypothetical protein
MAGKDIVQAKVKETIGHQLASVLPSDGKPWYKQGHLIRLNFIILSLVFLCESSFPQVPALNNEGLFG